MSELAAFHFLRPHWLWLALPALALTLLLWRAKRSEGSWARAVSPELLPYLLSDSLRRRSPLALPLLFVAWLTATLAAAGPSWQQLPQPVLQRQDALVLVMDLSFSMLATDQSPSRLDRMRRKLLDLLDRRQEGLTALVAYAGDAHVVAPLTDDRGTIANLLPALSPTMMPLPGSNPVDGIEAALLLLDSAAVRRGRILLITDGIEDSDRRAISERLAGSAHALRILAVGSEVGAPIPLPTGGFLKDGEGNIVIPTLDEAPLKGLATDSGGRYQRLSVDDSDLAALLDKTLAARGDDTIRLERRADQWQDMAHWLALPLLFALLPLFRRGWLYGLALLTVLPSSPGEAASWKDLWLTPDQQGQRALDAGDPARAATLFDSPLQRGAAAWEAGDYEAAGAAFARNEGADAWYNRGNALAAQGDFEAAINAYRRSLELDPGAEDAQQNIETLEKLLEQQQQQTPSQNGQQGNESDSDPASSESEDPGSSSSQQQGSDGESGERSDQTGQPDAQDDSPPADQPEPADSGERGEPGDDSEGQDGQESSAQRQPLAPSIDNSAMQEALERDQAMEQWLRRVPDDPSGLLREKFRYESRQRLREGESRATERIW